MIASFSLLNANEFSNLPRELTVFLFPVGGLEQHGPYLPIGTKLFQAEELTQALANNLQGKLPSWNFILMPVLPLAIDTITSKIALNVRPHVLRDALVDQCQSLKRMGFSQFAAVSSHLTPRQLSAIEDAGRIVSRRTLLKFSEKANLISVSSAKIRSEEVWKSPMISIPTEHAGAQDVAAILRANPKLVSAEVKTLNDQPRPEPGIQRFFDFYRHQIDGYWGKPKDANPSLDLERLKSEVEELAIKMKPVLEQGKGSSFFNSGYRYFPLNGSFFKAYVMAVIFFFMMLIWMLWSMKDIFDVS